ncbi:MAG TPA: hypothetical protein VFI90_06645 [Rubrobacter sp.]|nr:hypothetical protein [Rubrobacter sp.]
MKWSITVGASLVLAILLAQLATHTISAKAATADQSSGRQTRAEDFDRAVALMEEHMRVTRDGTLALDRKALTGEIKDGAARRIKPRTFTNLEEALAHTNAALRANRMEASDVFGSSEIDPSIQKTSFTTMGCRGRNGYEDFWWGRRSYLDDCRTHTLVDALRAGASICGALPSIQTRLCALLGGVGAIYIARVDRRGGHDGIYINWSPTLRVIYAIRSQ